MVNLVEQGWADRNDVARVFGCSSRTVRRCQRRFEDGRPGGAGPCARLSPWAALGCALRAWRLSAKPSSGGAQSQGFFKSPILRLGVTKKAVRNRILPRGSRVFKFDAIAFQPAQAEAPLHCPRPGRGCGPKPVRFAEAAARQRPAERRGLGSGEPGWGPKRVRFACRRRAGAAPADRRPDRATARSRSLSPSTPIPPIGAWTASGLPGPARRRRPAVPRRAPCPRRRASGAARR